MILSDRKIKEYGENLITPFNKENVSASSYDVVLDNQFKIYQDEILSIDRLNKTTNFTAERILLCPTSYDGKEEEIDYSNIFEKLNVKYCDWVLSDNLWLKERNGNIKLDKEDIIVHCGGLLGTTKECIKLPKNIACQYQGRSSYGRLFLQSHQTAGWIDSGYFGKITLEITALDKPVLLEANKRIGQLIFTYLTEKCQNPYNGKYQGQDGVVESKIYQDVK